MIDSRRRPESLSFHQAAVRFVLSAGGLRFGLFAALGATPASADTDLGADGPAIYGNSESFDPK